MKWEYKAVTLKADKHTVLSDALNEIGSDGWRLIHCDLSENCYIFERPVQPEIPFDKLFWELKS